MSLRVKTSPLFFLSRYFAALLDMRRKKEWKTFFFFLVFTHQIVIVKPFDSITATLLRFSTRDQHAWKNSKRVTRLAHNITAKVPGNAVDFSNTLVDGHGNGGGTRFCEALGNIFSRDFFFSSFFAYQIIGVPKFTN